ncbi:hypothetical protein [Amphritea sp.]|uniref:hypothetical protein n=1 Tax=Amphritea sp. TaxID=1872502 RepID=UPI003D145F46
MDMDVYQAPKANLVDEGPSQVRFYIVKPSKYLILSIATMGLYSLYWFYMHWQQYRTSTGEKVWPVPRALFAIFFTHSLFKKFDLSLKERGADFQWSPGTLATIYVITAVVTQVFDSLSSKEIGSPYTDLLSLALLPVTIWALYRAQCAANIASGDPQGESNATITVWNFIWILLGIGLWSLLLFGLFLVI